MTDQRTLKNIINEQRKEIEKWKHFWNEEAVKIENALEVLNDGSLWHWADVDTRNRLRVILETNHKDEIGGKKE